MVLLSLLYFGPLQNVVMSCTQDDINLLKGRKEEKEENKFCSSCRKEEETEEVNSKIDGIFS